MERRGRLAFVVIAGAVSLLVLVGVSAAAPGDLDPSFGGNGIVTTRFADDKSEVAAVAVASRGKLAAAGSVGGGYVREFAVARYNPDGRRDESFDHDGKVRTRIGEYDVASAIVVQLDGKLVAAGSSFQGSSSAFTLVRYNAVGSLDQSFDGDGIVRTELGYDSYAEALVLQSDGKLVAAGPVWKRRSSTGDFALARYNPDGSLDTSFGKDGRVRTDILGRDYAWALALQEDGKLVAAGESRRSETSVLRFALARYGRDGRLDKSFGGDGKVTTSIGGDHDVALALVVQKDGKLVAAGWGYRDGGQGTDITLCRYNPDGSLDTSFGGDGKVTTSIGDGFDRAAALAAQEDGKLVAAGSSDSDFALVRYNHDGSLDTSFGGDGIVTTDVARGGSDFADALVLQEDGKLVAGGVANNDFALARYVTG